MAHYDLYYDKHKEHLKTTNAMKIVLIFYLPINVCGVIALMTFRPF